MIRRFSAALIGLALVMPLAVSTVTAHTNGGVLATVTDTWVDAALDTHVVGTVTNHTSTRQRFINITATWAAPVASQSAGGLITSLAPHSTMPFEIIETDDAVAGATPTSVTATGQSQGITPVGALSIGEPSAVAANATTINITNDSGVALTGVVVYARRTGGTEDVAASAAAPLAIGATAAFTVTFSGESTGAVAETVVAQTTTGSYATSWNNLFSDLGSSNLAFIDDIAWMADEGITTGCGNNNFCPKAAVTRAQMAVFLDRVLELPDDNVPAHPFTDIAGQSATFQQAIQNVFAAGITAGCTTTTYCPTASVTRGQMSKFVVTGFSGDWPGGNKVISASTTNHFTDDNGHFSEPYNNGMKEAEVTSGCGATTYCPFSPVLREQMAVFMFNAAHLPTTP